MTRPSLLGSANVSKLTKGIHSNVVLSEIDPTDRRRNGEPSKKMIYIKFAKVNPTTRTKDKEVEVSWWKPDPVGNKYFQENMLELCCQLVYIMEEYMTKDEVDSHFVDVFEDYEFETVDDIKNYKWKKSELNTFLPKLTKCFYEGMKPFVGLDGKLLDVKLTTDHKGMGTEIPRYGKFIKAMDNEEITLKFSKGELKNHSASGITTKNDK